MKRLILVSVLLLLTVLTGCTFGTPTIVPTKTPIQSRFIQVPSPTSVASSKPRATLTPTITIAITISGTITGTAIIPTDTPTPVPLTVSELPDPKDYSWQMLVGGLNQPEGLVNAGDGSGRLFILEQAGLIRILKDGSLLPAPFLDLTGKVNCCGERGLLGLVFHPRYAENGYFYVDYTDRVDNRLFTEISRFSVSTDDLNVADPNSEVNLLHIEQPFNNHNGGQLQFGPDGYLYIGMGDGGSEGDPLGNGQSLETLLGKILRIDVDHEQPYAIPVDNPFVNGGGLAEIWAYGLRNPWRFSFDRLTGDLYIGDVGQDAWEEIDFLPAGSPGGANLGWNYYEGTHPYRGSPAGAENFVMPIEEYSHSLGEAVIGGYVYRGKDLLAWYGVYLYGDYGSGKIWGLLHLADGSWQNALLFETGKSISSFGQDENGEIYLVDDGGSISMLK